MRPTGREVAYVLVFEIWGLMEVRSQVAGMLQMHSEPKSQSFPSFSKNYVFIYLYISKAE